MSRSFLLFNFKISFYLSIIAFFYRSHFFHDRPFEIFLLNLLMCSGVYFRIFRNSFIYSHIFSANIYFFLSFFMQLLLVIHR